MDEQDMTWETPRTNPIYRHADGMVSANPSPGSVELSRFETPQEARTVVARWLDALDEISLFQRRLDRMDAGYAGTFDLFRADPPEWTLPAIRAQHRDATGVFSALLEAHPGARTEKFVAMGSPAVLAYWAGARATPLTDREQVMELYWERHPERRPEPRYDARVKDVREPATGKVWPSVVAMVAEVGGHADTAYSHLRGDPRYKTVKGRTFEYVEKDPDTPLPGSLAAMTEAEKEAARARARAAGMEPKF